MPGLKVLLEVWGFSAGSRGGVWGQDSLLGLGCYVGLQVPCWVWGCYAGSEDTVEHLGDPRILQLWILFSHITQLSSLAEEAEAFVL